jgi:hypothetical protein
MVFWTFGKACWKSSGWSTGLQGELKAVREISMDRPGSSTDRVVRVVRPWEVSPATVSRLGLSENSVAP